MCLFFLCTHFSDQCLYVISKNYTWSNFILVSSINLAKWMSLMSMWSFLMQFWSRCQPLAFCGPRPNHLLHISGEGLFTLPPFPVGSGAKRVPDKPKTPKRWWRGRRTDVKWEVAHDKGEFVDCLHVENCCLATGERNGQTDAILKKIKNYSKTPGKCFAAD